MERWVGKIAVVTGASAGVGASITVQLVKQGMIVIGVARRLEKIQKLQESVVGAKGKLVPLQGDVSKEEDIIKIFDFVKKTFGTIHVLVNNAGFAIMGTFIEGERSDWESVLDVNVIGLASCTRKAVQLMRDSGVDDGHIININSVAGHRIPPTDNPQFNIYPPSKYAVTAITETLRRELRYIKSKIRVTSLSPGFIKTEFQEVAGKNDPAASEYLSHYLKDRAALVPEDLAESVIYVLSAPPHVQIGYLFKKGIVMSRCSDFKIGGSQITGLHLNEKSGYFNEKSN